MSLATINKDKINSINKGLWTVNRYEFYVEIDINDNNKIYSRLINQNELVAIQTQLSVSNLLNGKKNNPYIIFNDQFEKMKEYKNVIEYLSQQGITKFDCIEKMKFEDFEYTFSEDWINYQITEENEDEQLLPKIYQNPKKIKYLTDNIQYSALRIIGEIIQEGNNLYSKLSPYVKCILGKEIPERLFLDLLDDFMKKQSFDILFDSFKLGYIFFEYFFDAKESIKVTEIKQQKDIDNIDSIKELNDKIQFNFTDKLVQCFDKNNLLFLKVIRPSHCYHCICSVTRIISMFNQNYSFHLNEKALIFCHNGGDFAERIDEISRTSVKDSQENNSNLTYFIVHPEMLNEEDHSFLVEFLNARLNSILDKNLPKVFIISSLDYRSFCYKHENKFNEIEIKIPKEVIKYLCKLSYPDDPDNYCYQLYYSENAGSGKTYQIIQDFKNNNNCIECEDQILKSLFVDIDMKKLPKLNYSKDGQTKEYQYLHLDLSPELFDNNYRFFDNLWTFAILHFQINPDGTNSNTPSNIFFEVPTLTEKQFPDGGFIEEADFPICCNYYHKISAKKISDDVETPAQIKIPESVKVFCDIIFKKEIENTSDLLSQALGMFYPKYHFDENCFVPRILEEINLFMDEFCKSLPLEDKNSIAIFLLLLRTSFHIWNMESLFKNKDQPKSFIIMSNQNLFSNKLDRSKWVLLCFSSINEKVEWNTNCLNIDIGEVDETILFDCDFFSSLLNNPNITIYSNQSKGNVNNYDDDQVYFFGIIKDFFYFNEDKRSLDIKKDKKDKKRNYNEITDIVILNNFKNSKCFKKAENVLPYIKLGKKAYEQNKEYMKIHKWTKTFDFLFSIFDQYDDVNILLQNLPESDPRIKEISNIKLTMTLVKRFVIMIIRIILKQPLIFEGFTGVGKTWSVKLLKSMIEIAEGNNDFKWCYHQIDCHGALQLKELLNLRENELNKKPDKDINHVFFMDELNTSPVSNYVINEMNNYHLKKKNLTKEQTDKDLFDNASIVFIAAINPYIEVDKFTRDLSRIGIRQIIPSRISKLNLCNITPKDNKNLYEVTDLNKLAYNVRELSDSTKMIVLKSDPELFLFDKNDEKFEESIYLPPDEIKTIGHIIDFYLNSLILQTEFHYEENILKNSKKTIIEDGDKRKENLDKIKNVVTDYKEAIRSIMLSLICKSFLEIRELMCLKSILSYRDVKRSMQFFILYFRKLIKVYLTKDESPDINREILVKKIIPQSIVLSIMISIVFRFSNETKIETADGNLSYSNEIEEKILLRCNKFGLELNFSKDRSYFKVGVRSKLLEKLVKIEWDYPFNTIKYKVNDWNNIVISYAWLKCMKYIYVDINGKEINSSLFKFNSLMVHLFSISSCYSACKNNEDSVIPCMIIGMPGTSKTLAIQLFTDYKQNKSKSKENFFNTTYLSTRVSEAEGLNAHYRDCAMFMLTHKNSFAICVIDELGLANLNETRPLKLLHYYFDKGIRMESGNNSINVPVMSIAASNYALDYANMNRGILVCTDLPTDDDVAEAFYFSELESANVIITNDKINEYKNKFFIENDFFAWKKDDKKINKYKNFLEILWKLTDKKERPDMLTLRPLYLLFNSIFHNKTISNNNDELIDNLCLYLISAISCKPSDSFEKVKELVNLLFPNNDNDENSLKYIINDQKKNNFVAFREIFNGPENSIFYERFCNIVRKQKAKEKHLEAYDTILGKIDEKKLNAFDIFKEAMENQDENDPIYNALERISNPGTFFKKLTEDINSPDYDNYKILRQSIISSINNSKRALCFRTENYECLDFIEELLQDIIVNYIYEEQEIEFTHIYPTDFKLPKQVSADDAIGVLLDIIEESKNNDKIYFFLIIGNVCLTDALLDLLNSPSEGKGFLETKKPLISRNGFSVELNEFPNRIIFCFIMNEKDFLNRNSVDSFPVPLLDRLNQICLDYNQKDEFGIIEKYKNYRLDNIGYSTPYATIIHNYFERFIKKLKNVPVPSGDNEYSVVYATTDITKDKYFYDETIEHEKFDLNDDYEDIEWKNKIILSLFYRRSGGIKKCQQNIKKFENDKNHKITFYRSNEFDKFSEIKKKFSRFNKFEIPLPKPDNYDYLENDGSINKLINKIKDQKKEDDDEEEEEETFRAIIVTTSPLMEDILLDNNSKLNTVFLFDQYIASAANFDERIEKENEKNAEKRKKIKEAAKEKNAKKGKKSKKVEEEEEVVGGDSIIVQLNHFQLEHDRFLRYQLETHDEAPYTIIIYHIKNSVMPEGLYTSKKWPVYWIESITDSPLSEFPTTEIVDCIRFKDVYRDKKSDLFMRIFRQVYRDIDSRFDDHIDPKKVEKILNSIFLAMNEKHNDNGISVLDMVNFNDLIDKFEGKTVTNSFKNLDFKREFCNTIINQIPFLNNLILILILAQDCINKRSTEDTQIFISKLFSYDNIEELFKKADLDNRNYKQLNNEGLYFPELIFPQVISIYEVYKKKGDKYPEIDKQTFKIFHDLQVNPSRRYLENYCNTYLQTYLANNKIYDSEEFNGFYDKLAELIK